MSFRSLIRRLNYKLIEYQKKRGTPVVIGYPYWLTVDPSSVCNLRCVFCPTGQRRGARAAALMPLARFRKIMQKLGPYLYHVDFCNWGEPMLNPELPEMIACAAWYGVSAKIDTNLGIDLTRDYADRLIRSGIPRINISIDGASRETYAVYRRDGDFEKVMSNFALLASRKKALGYLSPHLHWQFLVFKHNEHEIEKAKKLAGLVGADSIGFTAPFCAPEWVSTIDEYNNYRVKDGAVALKSAGRACNWLWDAITINADGSVSPCCSVEDEKDDFGNFFSKPFQLIWNGKKYRAARAHAAKNAPAPDNVCGRCDHMGASDHKNISPDEDYE